LCLRRSSGCGDGACGLCQYNPSRICKRNLKNKYLIDDHLKAKCGAGLRVEVVDESGQCVNDISADMELEVGDRKGNRRETAGKGRWMLRVEGGQCVNSSLQIWSWRWVGKRAGKKGEEGGERAGRKCGLRVGGGRVWRQGGRRGWDQGGKIAERGREGVQTDIAAEALEVKRAVFEGQLLPTCWA
jgi:hypothetical protein